VSEHHCVLLIFITAGKRDTITFLYAACKLLYYLKKIVFLTWLAFLTIEAGRVSVARYASHTQQA
jgi:hypothetical protein